MVEPEGRLRVDLTRSQVASETAAPVQPSVIHPGPPQVSCLRESFGAAREIDRIVAQSVFAIVPDGEIGLQRQTSFHFKLSLVGSSAQGERRRIVEVRNRIAPIRLD